MSRASDNSIAMATPVAGSAMAISPSMLLPVLLVASITLMVQASQNCIDFGWCKDELAFAVTVGTISAILLVLFLVYQRVCNTSAPQLKQGLSIFLALWWFIGACVFTFDSPYRYTSNGYFASWAGAISSALWACECCGSLKSNANSLLSAVGSSPIAGIAACSLIELITAAIVCDDGGNCEDERGWAVACGAVSLAISLIALLFASSVARFYSLVSVFLLVWWIPGVWVLTFSAYHGNFANHTGNGYFACWGALVFSAAFFMSQWFPGASANSSAMTLPTTASKTQNHAVGNPTRQP